ncbi:MAG: hypothetical protein NUK65_08420 [Firmicutes bacterium]|nr:hypothetical protein [Bacillota bacterium]
MLESFSGIAVFVVGIVIAIFILKTVLKVAMKFTFLAILVVLALLYFTGNLPFAL